MTNGFGIPGSAIIPCLAINNSRLGYLENPHKKNRATRPGELNREVSRLGDVGH